jgi:recombination protein RecA
VAECQRLGGIAAFIDAEHALDPTYAQKIGVKIEDIYVSQPDTGEQALDIAEALIKSGAIDLIVVDSVAALTPKAEIEGDMGDSHMGLQARLMSQGLRKLTGLADKNKTTIIFINQLRDKVGVIYGNPETTTGGKALKFYASVRIDVRKRDAIKDGNELLGNHVVAKVVKNKMAPPFKQAEFDILYGVGISKLSCILELAVDADIVHKSGAWFSYNGDRIGQGKDKAAEFLSKNPDIAELIEKQLREKYNLNSLERLVRPELPEVPAKK